MNIDPGVEGFVLVTIVPGELMPYSSIARQPISRFILSFAMVFFAGSPTWAAETASDSEAMVQEALKAELNGDTKNRQRLTQLALDQYPNDSGARWLSGFVKHEGQWMSTSQAAFMNGIDETITDYEELRDSKSGSLAGEVLLARWCRSKGLADRERMHWQKVLEFDSGNLEARKRLKLKNFRGQLLTTEQISAIKKGSGEYLSATRTWGPKLSRLRRELGRNGYDRSSDAWMELNAINDPQAVPSLEKMVRVENEQFQYQLIEIISNINSQSASDALVRLSLQLDDVKLRAAAAQGLSRHPLHAFVPQYLNCLESLVQYESSIDQVGDSIISHTRMRKERPDDAINLTNASSSELKLEASIIRGTNVYERAVGQEMRLQQRKVADRERVIEAGNQRIKSSNDRVFAALRLATVQDMDDTPRLWWDWWKQYNEYMIAERRPEYYLTTNTDYRERTIRLPRPAARHECFPAGTPVHTEIGIRAIETIRRGDKVLTQNPMTGELSFQLVTQTTLRPPSDAIRIKVDGEEITSTVGHPYWVIGKGWTMAKNLNPGDRLQSIGRTKSVDMVEQTEPVAAHNLIVDQTNAYFVGRTGLLVHDNVLRNASRIPIPGWNGK